MDKVCRKCKEVLPYTSFWRDTTTKDGLDTWCKVCRREWRKSTPMYNKYIVESEGPYILYPPPKVIRPSAGVFSSYTRRTADMKVSRGGKVYVVGGDGKGPVWLWRKWKSPIADSLLDILTLEEDNYEGTRC